MCTGTLTEPNAQMQRLQLPSVTLVAVSSIAVAATVRALRLSLEKAAFARALLLTHQPPAGLAELGITARRIAPITSRGAYSRFLLDCLADHVDTEFALVVQWDGYITTPTAWSGAFLNVDYIGAPWPHHHDNLVVGNGGFSLRSKRLLLASRGLQAPEGEPEDVTLGRRHRRTLEARDGLRFASRELAAAFSFERGTRSCPSFGFHGIFNMIRDVDPKETLRVLRSLEAGVLGRKEADEVLTWALQSRKPSLIKEALRQRYGRSRIAMLPTETA